MANIEAGIRWAKSKWHGPKYVMGAGRNYDLRSSTNMKAYDCSSFAIVYLYMAGLIPNRRWNQFRHWGITEDIFRMRYEGLCREIPRSQVRRGDVFVSGKEGASAGAAGHTGVFLSHNEIIHMTPGPQRAYWTVITTNPSEGLNYYIGNARFFRFVAGEKQSKPNKSNSTVAKEVLKSKYGVGAERKRRLEAAGYNYQAVQNEVNRILKSNKKDILSVAKEVLNGKYGNGKVREQKIKELGLNYNEVQAVVNKLIVAKDVIAGKYGNGQTRINKLKAKGYNAKEIQDYVNKLL